MSSNQFLNQSRAYNGGGRKELFNLELNVLKGALPSDIGGVAYFNSMCGSVNSNGLPYPRTLPNGTPNNEFGSPFINGDGMVYAFDFQTPGSARVNSRLMKTPCYYADEATSRVGKARATYASFEFKNLGIARMSMLLGSRNFINTALIPVKFDNDSGVSLLATVDNGRPFKMDPKSLKLITPVGWNREWAGAMPPIMTTPFPMVATSAHPSFDAVTRELFTVNYTQSLHTETTRKHLREFLHHDCEGLQKGLHQIAQNHDDHKDDLRAVNDINNLLLNRQKRKGKLGQIWDKVKSFFKKLTSEFSTVDKVFLMKFTNQGDMIKWQLVDEQGKSLVINQCMHQTSLSKNYILLMDSSFKFAIELLFSNPFPEDPRLDEFLRRITSRTMLPYTEMWLIDRRTLTDSSTTAYAKKLPGNIPFECIHFTTEYDDDQDQLTIYTLHNNAACFAEWIRGFDTNYFNGTKYPDYLIGDFATGEMALGAVGKFVIDGKTATIKQEHICREVGKNINYTPGSTPNVTGNIGANTWGIGLYAFNAMISPTVPNRKISKLHFINFGANPDFLTQWIYDLYKDYANRDMALSDFLKFTEQGIPSSIVSISTSDMSFTSYLQLEVNMHPMSIQFVPRTHGGEEGYLLVTMKVPSNDSGGPSYHAELWILDSTDVSKGPICILGNPDFNFCFTAHSTWLPNGATVESGYHVDIRKDYSESIEKSIFYERGRYRKFFNEFVFPHFD